MKQPWNVSLRERALIEWVAQASPGDPFPEPWSYASKPLVSIIRTLVTMEVMDKPAADADPATLARDAGAAARTWLEAHPQPNGA